MLQPACQPGWGGWRHGEDGGTARMVARGGSRLPGHRTSPVLLQQTQPLLATTLRAPASAALLPGYQLPPPATKGDGQAKCMPHAVLLEGRFLLSGISRASPDAAPSTPLAAVQASPVQKQAQHLLLHQFPSSTAHRPLSTSPQSSGR